MHRPIPLYVLIGQTVVEIRRYNGFREPSAILSIISVFKANRFITITISIFVEIGPSVAKIHYIAIYRLYFVGCHHLGFTKIRNFNVRSVSGSTKMTK